MGEMGLAGKKILLKTNSLTRKVATEDQEKNIPDCSLMLFFHSDDF
jgi:hypothetical protein